MSDPINVYPKPLDYQQLARDIKRWGRELGFQQIGITDTDLSREEQRLEQWLANDYHGSMDWMAAHGDKRSRPEELVPGTRRVISARMNYLPENTEQIRILKSPEKAYISRYTLGRDYHKLIRKRLAQLGKRIEQAVQDLGGPEVSQRAFVDSAPVMERPLAEKAGLGWTGKHTLIINSEAGSWFFLGELLTNLPLPVDTPDQPNRCGECTACLKVCPTDAFPKPYQLDARRCISYLTIEHDGPIPEEFRQPMGNRVFGCDDCQAICPWNKLAHFSEEDDFSPRHQFDRADLLDLFLWDEETYLKRTEGSAMRRVGYDNWQRNLSIGLGNAPTNSAIVDVLEARLSQTNNPMLQEHFRWALTQQQSPPKRRQRKIKNPNKIASD